MSFVNVRGWGVVRVFVLWLTSAVRRLWVWRGGAVGFHCVVGCVCRRTAHPTSHSGRTAARVTRDAHLLRQRPGGQCALCRQHHLQYAVHAVDVPPKEPHGAVFIVYEPLFSVDCVPSAVVGASRRSNRSRGVPHTYRLSRKSRRFRRLRRGFR